MEDKMSRNRKKFKVGDIIKYINPIPPHFTGQMGVIEEVRGRGKMYPYKILFDNGIWYPVLASDIEKIPIKGQQLLFAFME